MKPAQLKPAQVERAEAALKESELQATHSPEKLAVVEVPEQRSFAEEPATTDSKSEKQGHLAAIRGRISDWGIRRALFWQIMHLLKENFGICLSYVFVSPDRMDLRDPNPPEIPPGYETFMATKADFQPFVGKVEFLDQAFIDEAFANGDEASMTLFNGELVSYGFATRVKARVTSQLELHVPKNFRYAFKSWTRDDHRRNHISRMGTYVRAFHNPMRKFEERSIYTIVVHNYASLLHGYRFPSERGFKMGFVGWFSFFGKQIPFNSRKAKWIGLEVRRRGDERVRQYVN